MDHDPEEFHAGDRIMGRITFGLFLFSATLAGLAHAGVY